MASWTIGVMIFWASAPLPPWLGSESNDRWPTNCEDIRFGQDLGQMNASLFSLFFAVFSEQFVDRLRQIAEHSSLFWGDLDFWGKQI